MGHVECIWSYHLGTLRLGWSVVDSGKNYWVRKIQTLHYRVHRCLLNAKTPAHQCRNDPCGHLAYSAAIEHYLAMKLAERSINVRHHTLEYMVKRRPLTTVAMETEPHSTQRKDKRGWLLHTKLKVNEKEETEGGWLPTATKRLEPRRIKTLSVLRKGKGAYLIFTHCLLVRIKFTGATNTIWCRWIYCS